PPFFGRPHTPPTRPLPLHAALPIWTRPAATASAVAPIQRATRPAGQDQVCAIRQSIAAEGIARTSSTMDSVWRYATRVPGRRAGMLATEATPVQRNPGAILTGAC